MGNTPKKPGKVGKLIKYGGKLKKMVTFLRRSNHPSVPTSPCRAVCCDELFKKSSDRCKDADRNDPILAAYIIAQKHFSHRPNLHI